MQIRKLLIAVAALSTISSAAYAQASATASATSSATIMRPISIAKNSDLAFQKMIRPTTTTSTVVINAATGARTISGGDGVLITGGTPTRAAFTVTGEGAQTFSITTPATVTMANAGASGGSVVVTLTASAATGTLSGLLGDLASGTATFGVGGSLPVTITQNTGSYSGSFNMTVQYN